MEIKCCHFHEIRRDTHGNIERERERDEHGSYEDALVSNRMFTIVLFCLKGNIRDILKSKKTLPLDCHTPLSRSCEPQTWTSTRNCHMLRVRSPSGVITNV